MKKDKSYKLGIIGPGVIAETRLMPAITATEKFDISYIYDSDPARLDYISKKYSIPAASSLEDLLALDIDAVYIATPNNDHVQPVIKALKSGKGVLVEKPCAGTIEGAEELLKASRETDKPLIVGYMSKWNRNNQVAQKMIQENRIGKMQTFTATFGWFNRNNEAWRLFRSKSGPGALADIGIYAISTALDMFGEMPVSCSAVAHPAGNKVYGDKYLSGRVNFSGGRWMQIEVSLISSSCGYTVVGTEGAIHVGGSWAQSGEGEVVICRENSVEKIPAEVVNPYEEEIRCFADCLGGNPVPAFMGIERAVEDIRVMDALDRSAALMGKEVKIG